MRVVIQKLNHKATPNNMKSKMNIYLFFKYYYEKKKFEYIFYTNTTTIGITESSKYSTGQEFSQKKTLISQLDFYF